MAELKWNHCACGCYTAEAVGQVPHQDQKAKLDMLEGMNGDVQSERL